MNKIKKRSTFKHLALMFVVVSLVTALASSVAIYCFISDQMYARARLEMQRISTQLHDELSEDDPLFHEYVNYMLSIDRDTVKVPAEFTKDDCKAAKKAFYDAFEQAYPDKEFGKDVSLDELPDNLKEMFITWYMEHWTLRAEYYESIYNAPYIYFIRPTGEGGHVLYIIDLDRCDEGETTLRIWDDFVEDPKEMPVAFDTWAKGYSDGSVDIFDNDYGPTITNYEVLYLGGEKVGVICVDFDTSLINSRVLRDTLVFSGILGLLMLVFDTICLVIVKQFYVRRLRRLNDYVEAYARDKDYTIIDTIKSEIKFNDDIDALSWRIISLINQIHCHLTDMMMVTESLSASNEEIQRLVKLSETDGLTKLMNKTAFIQCEKDMNEHIARGDAHLAVVMLDLNFLKKTNDTYGHDKGDAILKRVAGYLHDVFGEQKVFRIGGDEFVVVYVECSDSTVIEKDLDKFYSAVRKDNAAIKAQGNSAPWQQLSVAAGYAELHEDDATFNDVFKRADHLMYLNKKTMKAERTD